MVSKAKSMPALLLAAGVLCVGVVNFRSGAWGRDLSLLSLLCPGRPMGGHTQVDRLFLRQTPSHNVWVRFEGFDHQDAQDKGFVTHVYYRGNYAIYPRRVYVSPPSTVITDCKTIVENRALAPDLAEALGVQWMVVFSREAPGKIAIEIGRWP